MYPHVLNNSILHYFEDRGILITDVGNYVLNDVEIYMIEKFSGNKSINEITSEIAIELETDDKFKIENIMMDFIKSKSNFIFLSELPKSTYFKKTGLKDAKVPMGVVLSLTDKCNLNCIHCFKKCSNKNDDFIPYNELIDTLSFLKDKTTNIQLTGGEPMLHNKFFDILKHCIDNFDTSITTNGTLINSENVNNYKGVNTVQISMYSYEENKHDLVTTVSGSFRKTINAINELSKIKIPSTVSTIITKQNINNIENMIEFTYKIGASSIRFGNLTSSGRAASLSSLVISQEDIKNVEYILDDLSEKYRNKIRVLTWREDENKKGIDFKHKSLECGAGLLNWCISEAGIIKPCEFLDDDVCPIGNIKENKVEELVKNYNLDKMTEGLIRFEKKLNKENTSIKNMCQQIKNYYLQYCISE
ncbi:radical SAM protein [Tissierella sp. MSJ-40]|uniref:Radical SAM protein n=1 Tax=Tissierella simiarum TaxID=2841534 RepID=A0ABS6E1Y9_9FIRM|nr:radical SAM protein [Tissierella simiarum]MBU5436920.1 radical SAM protein [Tissierella simiarum]